MSNRKILRHADTGNIWTYYDGKTRNPCGCGSNCFHYECDGENIVAVCNSCGTDIYQVKPEFVPEYLSRGVWLAKEGSDNSDKPVYLPGPEKALRRLRSRIVQVHLNAEPDVVEVVLPLTMDAKDTEAVDLYLESFIEPPIDYWEVLV